MQVVILAGGLGTRLRPITSLTPKPMVTINDKPYLEYQLEYLRQYSLKEILILTGYLGEQIQSYFGDGEKMGLKIEYSQEAKPLGTGGALKLAQNKLKKDFMLIYGDSFLPLDLKELISFYRKKTQLESVVVGYSNQDEETLVTNNLLIDQDGYVIKYQKNGGTNFTLVESGISILKKKVVSEIPENKQCSLEEEVFPKLIARKELLIYISPVRFYDIGTPERLKKIADYFSQ